MSIQPVNIPSAAGINYGDGDVRHLTVGDALDVPGLSTPTRQLAERDNILAEKVNEVIATVNNHEQFVPLPVPRTIIAPGEQVLVTNYRVPAGFEARVFNATVAANPSSLLARLEIFYNTSYGNSTGSSIVTATSGTEFTGETSFHPAGEFIVSLKNTGSVTIEVSASVTLSMRPLGYTASLLVGSPLGPTGPTGAPGPQGPQGPTGPAGIGSAGPAGMNWRGTWSNATTYHVNDVVHYTRLSGVVSSFICRSDNLNQNPETFTSAWDPVAEGGAAGLTGGTGPTGPAGGAPTFASGAVSTTYATGGGFSSTASAPYSAITAGPGTLTGFKEFTVANASGSPKGMSTVIYKSLVKYKGTLTITLPLSASAGQYTTSDVAVSAVSNGDLTLETTVTKTIDISFPTSSTVAINVRSAAEQFVSLSIIGFKSY